MKLKNGQWVRHAKFGWGMVLEVNRDHTIVHFSRVGLKKFTPSDAAFQIVEDAASANRQGWGCLSHRLSSALEFRCEMGDLISRSDQPV